MPPVSKGRFDKLETPSEAAERARAIEIAQGKAMKAAAEIKASLEHRNAPPDEDPDAPKPRLMGVVIHWSAIRGFGILRNQVHGEVFVHARSLVNAAELVIGDVVTFELGFDPTRKPERSGLAPRARAEAIKCMKAGIGGYKGPVGANLSDGHAIVGLQSAQISPQEQERRQRERHEMLAAQQQGTTLGGSLGTASTMQPAPQSAPQSAPAEQPASAAPTAASAAMDKVLASAATAAAMKLLGQSASQEKPAIADSKRRSRSRSASRSRGRRRGSGGDRDSKHHSTSSRKERSRSRDRSGGRRRR